MDVHSDHGDVTLAIPEKSDFDLEGTARKGDISNDFGDVQRVDESGHSATIRGKQGNGPVIRVSTDRGTLTVKKN
jgi:hypothetical protein